MIHDILHYLSLSPRPATCLRSPFQHLPAKAGTRANPNADAPPNTQFNAGEPLVIIPYHTKNISSLLKGIRSGREESLHLGHGEISVHSVQLAGDLPPRIHVKLKLVRCVSENTALFAKALVPSCTSFVAWHSGIAWCFLWRATCLEGDSW